MRITFQQLIMTANWKESDYFKQLEPNDRENYKSKLMLTNGKILPDPFTLTSNWSNDVTLIPEINWPDIYNYLINTPSQFTYQSLKAYKSLESFNFFRFWACARNITS